MAPQNSESIVRALLEPAEIEINGKNPWDIQIHNPNFYSRVLNETSMGLGESYMDGWWDCEAMDELVYRVLKTNIDSKVRGNWKIALQVLRSRLFNLQTRSRALKVGEYTYDLGNDLYCAMLDKRLNYTCGYWKDATNLDDAQDAKLELVCRKIGLKAGMRVLEFGCGWGSFAAYAAEKYGAHVTGVTISREQLSFAQEVCKGLPVELRFQDYREVEGKFDAVISIGMVEHVGYKNYGTYMQVVDRCLDENGIALIHCIGNNQSMTFGDAWTTTYIFPNGMLPSIAQLGKAMEEKFVMEDWHNFAPHYVPTLLAWYANFEKAWPALRAKYGDRFYRMWRYYLLNSAGAFRARAQQLWQIVFTRRGTTQPECRYS
ncbi:MAG TPA: cyclopropane fatty acyl phospholipid synthase [Anaerolineaceae bacterium]|nr:cyclopropane fatty acyl phospholipid synthase [Anaerolineaceae bacterium]